MSEEPVGARLQHDRQHEIYRLALRDGSVDVANLAQRFAVTTETIRRDLSDLQHRRLVRRVHGGAVPTVRANHEPSVDARDMQNADEKLRIAERAAAEVPERGSVLIDSGSTGQRLAEVFPVDRDVHVVTNSLMTALTLSRRGLKQLTVLGGSVTSERFAMLDTSALLTLQDMSVDVLFISCDGLSLRRGLTTPYREEQTMKRAMIASSRQVVGVVDASKFGSEQLFGFARPAELDLLITDTRAEPAVVESLCASGLEVHCV